ncbi:MAG: hypothetical protein RLZZ399_1607 [Verrucomicrobiota bacterium]|jgi:glutathione peroxidase
MKRRTFLLLGLALMQNLNASPTPDLLGVSVRDIRGRETTLGSFAGKVLLVVNVASECGYTQQYEGLEALYRSYRDAGLVVLGFPCNDFGSQEPGDEKEIERFCSSRFQVTFPMFSKVSIAGPGAHPLFAGLTGPNSPFPGPVQWNFQKFLIGRDGVLSARFDSSTEPDSEMLKSAIEKALRVR